jgi:hypothetical protein
MRHNDSYSHARRLLSLTECKRLFVSSFILLGIGFPHQVLAQPAMIWLSRHVTAKAHCIDEGTPAIIYTGKTYGYLRDNDHMPNSVGDEFVATYDNISDECPQAILVGTGDNFAPDFGSRYPDFDPSIYIPGPHKPSAYDPNKLNPVHRLGPGAPSNNHAVQFFKNFSNNQHYDALVPGQLDFYFGADFLWYVDPELPMLADNLTIKSTKQNPPPQPVCAQSQLLLPTQVSQPLQSGPSGGGKGKSGGKGGQGGSGQGSSGSAQSGSGQLGQLCLQPPSPGDDSSRGGLSLVSPSSDSVSPWTTEFEFSITQPASGLQALLCQWLANPPKVRNCITLNPPLPSGGPTHRTYVSEVPGSAITIDINSGILTIPSTSIFRPGADLELCVKNNGIETCTGKPFRVQTPFFSRAWVVVNKGNVKYVVFGVLDPAIQGLISPENSSWGSDDQYTSQINIADPAAPLEQLVTTFQKIQLRAGNDPSTWNYVLLAQMQRPQAQALAATLRWHQEHLGNLPTELKESHRFHFDVILSAADYDEATPDMTLTIDQKHAPTPVITPHPVVTEAIMRNPLEVLEIEKSNADQPRYTNDTDPSPWTEETFEAACGKKMADTIMTVLNNASKSPCNLSSPFQCLVLEQMRQQLHADAAFLQHRDFYDQCNYEGPASGPPSAEMVERVLWNSGYLTRVSASGATLRAILQASDKLAEQEKSSTNEPVERNRDLVYLGITKSKSNGLYYINGAALEDSKIYSIATSDQLALGDSAYPQFSQVDLVLPTVFTGLDKKTFEIAQLTLASKPFGGKPDPLPRVKVVAAGLALATPPSVTGPKPSLNPFKPTPDPFKPSTRGELAVQDRNFLTMTLQQASIGYTNSNPNQTDANINHNLAGVTNPNVAAPHSDNLSYSDSFRLVYQWTKYWDFGLDQIITFARSRQGSLTASAQMTPTGQPVPPESINLSANTLIVSPFIDLQPHRYQKHLKAVARPVTFSTGLSRTLQFLTTKTPGEVYELNLRRQENWQPSVGARYEWNNLNFFETGYLNQTARNVVSALTVNGKTTPLTAGTTVSEVANVVPNPGSTAIPTYATFHQQGAYWLGMYTHRFRPNAKTVKVTYQGITYGNFLAYGAADRTSTALTRYAAELSNSLQIQLWGNVSLGPSYNLFWFQDQSHNVGNSLTRRDWNVQLNYSFDWHQGLEWKDALEGKTGQ